MKFVYATVLVVSAAGLCVALTTSAYTFATKSAPFVSCQIWQDATGIGAPPLRPGLEATDNMYPCAHKWLGFKKID